MVQWGSIPHLGRPNTQSPVVCDMLQDSEQPLQKSIPQKFLEILTGETR